MGFRLRVIRRAAGRQRFKQHLGTVAKVNQDWSLGRDPSWWARSWVGLQRSRVASCWPIIGQSTRHFLDQWIWPRVLSVNTRWSLDTLFNRYQAINLLVSTSLEHADLASLGKVMGRSESSPSWPLWVKGFFWKHKLRLGFGGLGQKGRKIEMFVFFLVCVSGVGRGGGWPRTYYVAQAGLENLLQSSSFRLPSSGITGVRFPMIFKKHLGPEIWFIR